MANILEVVRGAALRRKLTVADESDSAVTTYAASATLAASCWRGDDQAELFAPAVAWISAPAGTIALTVSAAQSATLAPGDYQLLLAITAAGDPVKRPIGTLRVLPAPGSAAPRPVYCTWDETLRHAGSWAARLQHPDVDQAGFAEERADARERPEELIHAAWDPGRGAGRRMDFEGAYAGLPGASGLRDPWLVAALAADRLILSRRAKALCSCLALETVCRRQIDPAKDEGWAAAAAWYAGEAGRLAKLTTAEVDADGDGLGEVAIRLGAVRVARA